MSTKVKVEWNVDIALAALKNGSRKGTWSALDVLARHSKEQVPLDSGALKASCAVDVSPDGMQGTVSYDTPYACRWHEEDANFQRGRKKKYLEDPMNDGAVQSEMLEALKHALQSVF